MSLILKAAALALRAHEGQKRKYSGLPYITHPARVAGRVGILPGVTEELVAAAYLHDVLEDVPAITREMIEAETNAQVGFYVDCMTNRSKDSGLPRAQRKAMDRDHLSKIPDEVKQIKALDRIDNLLDCMEAPKDFKKLYSQESLLLADVLGTGPLVDELRAIARKMKESVSA
jgi:guanosine-3',5'-bis(diphosphate) 3'-pyrophosphohydrolase